MLCLSGFELYSRWVPLKVIPRIFKVLCALLCRVLKYVVNSCEQRKHFSVWFRYKKFNFIRIIMIMIVRDRHHTRHYIIMKPADL